MKSDLKKEIECLNTMKIKELNIEVERKIHDKGKILSDIEIPKGWRLLTLNEIVFLYNNYEKELNMKDTFEFFVQPFNKNNNSVAWFGALSGRALLNCSGDLGSGSSLGVRFCRSLI